MEDPVVMGLLALATALATALGKSKWDKWRGPGSAPVKPIEEQTLRDVEALLEMARPIVAEIKQGDFIKIKDIVLQRDTQGRPRVWFPAEPLERLSDSVRSNAAKVERLETLMVELLNLIERRVK